MSTSKLSDAINRYDQYGIMRVNALQSLMVTICMFLVNFIFSPPYIQQLMPLFLIGLIAAATSPSFIRRQQIVILMTIIVSIWLIAMSLVQKHNVASVLLTGILLSSMFVMGKKIPILGSIAVTCYMTGTILPQLSPSGNIYVYYDFIVMTSIFLMLIIVFMNFFPRVYYLRIWLRVYCLSLKELSQAMRDLAKDELTIKKFRHLAAMHQITSGLSKKEYTFAARRINISLLRIYKYFTAVRMNAILLDKIQLLEIAQICDDLYLKISEDQPLKPLVDNSAGFSKDIYYAIEQLVLQWNKLCSKA